MAIKSLVKQVSGDEAPVQGMGIVLAKMKDSKDILVLYPCYHMQDNPQSTLGLPALKYYGEMRSVRTETLSWIRLVNKNGVKSFQSTIPYYHKSQLMDYVPMTILQHDQVPIHPPKQCSVQMYRMTHTNMLKDSSHLLNTPQDTYNHSQYFPQQLQEPKPPSQVLPANKNIEPSGNPTDDDKSRFRDIKEKSLPSDQKEFLHQTVQSDLSYAPCKNPTDLQYDKATFKTQMMMLQKILPHCTTYTHAFVGSILSTLLPPQINASFTKNEDLDWTIIHRRLDHINDEKLALMCTQQLMTGLPKKFPSKARIHKQICWICPRGDLNNDPHGVTINTDHLRPGQLIHMDFYFINATSIRHFTAILLILDGKTRKLWQFPTQQKRPPLDIVNFFLLQLKRMERKVQPIRTDCGGELAGSSEFCALIKNKFAVGLERTGTYSSWLNGKAERHVQTACNMLRMGQTDHGLGDKLWCCKCEDTTQKYNAIVHSAHGEVPDFLYYGRRPNA